MVQTLQQEQTVCEANNNSMTVEIFTDGSCNGNPGSGGCAAVVKCGAQSSELVRSYKSTTNNRMELMAAIMALETVPPGQKATVFSDSEYVIKGFTEKRVEKWRRNKWKTSTKKPVKNVDLWKRLHQLVNQRDVEFIWVRGHSTSDENIRADQLAFEAACSPKNAVIDIGLEENIQ